jgi:hypothetical protein
MGTPTDGEGVGSEASSLNQTLIRPSLGSENRYTCVHEEELKTTEYYIKVESENNISD